MRTGGGERESWCLKGGEGGVGVGGREVAVEVGGRGGGEGEVCGTFSVVSTLARDSRTSFKL